MKKNKCMYNISNALVFCCSQVEVRVWCFPVLTPPLGKREKALTATKGPSVSSTPGDLLNTRWKTPKVRLAELIQEQSQIREILKSEFKPWTLVPFEGFDQCRQDKEAAKHEREKGERRIRRGGEKERERGGRHVIMKHFWNLHNILTDLYMWHREMKAKRF